MPTEFLAAHHYSTTYYKLELLWLQESIISFLTSEKQLLSKNTTTTFYTTSVTKRLLAYVGFFHIYKT